MAPTASRTARTERATVRLHCVQVLHNTSRDAFFGLNTVFEQTRKVDVPQSHKLTPVFTYWTSSDAGEIPEEAFFEFNVSNDSEFTDGSTHRLALAYRRNYL